MRYKAIQKLSDEAFKRSTGVSHSTLVTMLQVVEDGMSNLGRRPKLSRADQLLLTLMCWLEYRAEFHIGLTCSISEAAVCRTIQKIENVLIRSERFRLPGRKALQSGEEIEIVAIDAAEQPIERPKKNNGGIAAAKNGGARRKCRLLRI
jgi:hypothetical protein